MWHLPQLVFVARICVILEDFSKICVQKCKLCLLKQSRDFRNPLWTLQLRGKNRANERKRPFSNSPFMNCLLFHSQALNHHTRTGGVYSTVQKTG